MGHTCVLFMSQCGNLSGCCSDDCPMAFIHSIFLDISSSTSSWDCPTSIMNVEWYIQVGSQISASVAPLHSHNLPLDLKPANVLLGLEKSLSLDDIVSDEIESPSPRKIFSDCTIYLSHNDFGHPKSAPGRQKISDFDNAVLVTGDLIFRTKEATARWIEWG